MLFNLLKARAKVCLKFERLSCNLLWLVNIQNLNHPPTDVVILAGGQARRMNDINKLLQNFDDQIQLIKLHQCFKSQGKQIWMNSHRNHSISQMLVLHAKGAYVEINGVAIYPFC